MNQRGEQKSLGRIRGSGLEDGTLHCLDFLLVCHLFLSGYFKYNCQWRKVKDNREAHATVLRM